MDFTAQRKRELCTKNRDPRYPKHWVDLSFNKQSAWLRGCQNAASSLISAISGMTVFILHLAIHFFVDGRDFFHSLSFEPLTILELRKASGHRPVYRVAQYPFVITPNYGIKPTREEVSVWTKC